MRGVGRNQGKTHAALMTENVKFLKTKKWWKIVIRVWGVVVVRGTSRSQNLAMVTEVFNHSLTKCQKRLLVDNTGQQKRKCSVRVN